MNTRIKKSNCRKTFYTLLNKLENGKSIKKSDVYDTGQRFTHNEC